LSTRCSSSAWAYEENPEIKTVFEKQADAYRKIAKERANKLGCNRPKSHISLAERQLRADLSDSHLLLYAGSEVHALRPHAHSNMWKIRPVRGSSMVRGAGWSPHFGQRHAADSRGSGLCTGCSKANTRPKTSQGWRP
jgi:hypothetical protein